MTSYQQDDEFKGSVEHVEAEKVSHIAAGPSHKTFDSEDLDAGAALVGDEKIFYTEAENKAVLRKIDWRLMPLAAWACGLQYVDKTALGAANTYGMSTDLSFKAGEYSWSVSAFYLGYLVGTPIMAQCLQRYHAGKVISISFVLWGASLFGMCGVTNFAGVMAMRLLLGIFESSLAPGLLLITTSFYKQREQPLRFGLWTLSIGVLPVLFLLIAYGFGFVKSGPLQDWRLIFLLLGILSVITGIGLFFCLPDTPASCGWLTPREKEIAVSRINESQTGMKNTHFKWHQAKEAFTDFRVWLIVCEMLFSQFISAVTTNFIGTLIKGLGFTALRAQLLTAPNFAVQGLTQLIVSLPPTLFFVCRNFKQPIMATTSLIALTGNLMLWFLPQRADNQNTRLAAVIIISTSGANYAQILSTVGCNVAGYTKKQVVTTMVFVAYCVSSICSPQAFLTREAPGYHTGLATTATGLILFVLCSWTSWFVQRHENARRDKLAIHDPAYRVGDDNEDVMSGLRDLTDRENKHFRYSG